MREWGIGVRGVRATVVTGLVILIVGCGDSADPERAPSSNGSRFRECQDQELGELHALGGRLVSPQQVPLGRYEYRGSRLLVTQSERGKTRAAVYIEDAVPRQGDPSTQLLCTRGFGTLRLEGQIEVPAVVEIDRKRQWNIERQRSLEVDMGATDVVHVANHLQQKALWTPQQLVKEMETRRLQNGDLFLVEVDAQTLDLVMIEESAKTDGSTVRKSVRVRLRQVTTNN
ncbi:MAG: hypothetical protein IT288_03715 [Bdellovibrionales bacterium]|nr:hypothetical protein [Bdellovibrionales bacterium]